MARVPQERYGHLTNCNQLSQSKLHCLCEEVRWWGISLPFILRQVPWRIELIMYQVGIAVSVTPWSKHISQSIRLSPRTFPLRYYRTNPLLSRSSTCQTCRITYRAPWISCTWMTMAGFHSRVSRYEFCVQSYNDTASERWAVSVKSVIGCAENYGVSLCQFMASRIKRLSVCRRVKGRTGWFKQIVSKVSSIQCPHRWR